MSRPQKYAKRNEAQAVYKRTPSGVQVQKSYESSPLRQAGKRQWWNNHKKQHPDKRKAFVEKYGNPAEALSRLSEKEQQIVALYFGINGESCSLREIGDRLGVTAARAQQLKTSALSKLLPGGSTAATTLVAPN